MRNGLAIGMAGLVLLAGGGGAARGAEQRLAVVDMERVLDAYPETREARAQLKQKLEKYEAERKDMLQRRNDMVDELKALAEAADNKALSAEAQAAKKDAARAKQKEIADYESRIRESLGSRQKDLSAEEETLVKAIVTKLEFVVSKYAEEKGLDIVMDKSASKPNGVHVVTFSARKVDITDDIIARVSGDAKADKAADVKADGARDGDGGARDAKKTKRAE